MKDYNEDYELDYTADDLINPEYSDSEEDTTLPEIDDGAEEYNSDNLINAETEIEMLSFDEASYEVQVQLFTGLSVIYALPLGGEEGQALVKRSDKNQDVEWKFDTPIIKITPALSVDESNKYYYDLSSSYKLLGVFSSVNGQPILYETTSSSNGTRLHFEQQFVGYIIAIKINKIEEIE